MTATSRTVAVVLAGGIGVRVGLGIPKQLIKIAGKAIVEHTLETLDAHPLIDEVIIMMNAGSLSELDHLLSGRFRKLTRVLPGGETRNDTTQLAIAAIEGDDTKVLFHDAVRPFIDDRIIRDCVDALDTYDAVDTAIPSADTIIQVDDARHITGIPDRSTLRRGQTPQAFRLGTIRRAYEIAAGDLSFRATDDCGVVFQYLPETPIYVVDGTPENMKVTEPIDVHIADKIFQLQSASLALDTRTDQLPDFAGRTVVVFGGSYGIGASIVDLATEAGAQVFEFSRSTTGTDVRRPEDVRDAFDTVIAATGAIDVVVVTAGVLRISPLIDASADDLADTIETNLLAPVLIAREAYPHLASTSGQVVLFTSSSYTRGRAGYGVYSATKAGVVNLTQALSEEWAPQGVRINCINPQRTHTPMRTAAFGEEPAGTLLEPADVARVTLSVAASDLTGQIVTVQVAAMKAHAG
ncbi:bifunctional cytidylyltransferase/SDR family oxidoreductase [Microbacterium invictum]|uniref:2-C-methyl-D-erythritol 4-phosphate cytidylyltransferase n=1 Tax=Microbacterium invictum TaxID=515415 RepID=A0AA40VLV7_9MICO|nr:bifunctional cytidylyltransferase/SDR family oxidoreductase [Microbacterium invictum]MBB4139756.1 2-C-methyl-D-erythritol 4-phosphate cytidylyltransferase [Microbacterium invictum]